MTHRDRACDPSGHRAGQRAGRRETAGDAGHRQGFPTPSGGSPARPERRLPKAFGRPNAFERGARLAMPCIAAPRAPGRKPWETVSMGHYQRSLVSRPATRWRGTAARRRIGTCARCSAGTRADRARIFALIGALASKRRPGLSVGYWAFGFCSRVSTGPPASHQAVKPPPMWQTGARPMSCAALAASAERQPMEQKNTNRLPDWKMSLA